jgi:hypothetical protein
MWLQRKLNLSTIQMAGFLAGVVAGIVDGLLTKSIHDGLLMTLIIAILTLCVDVTYGALDNAIRIHIALELHPALRGYRYCIYEYGGLHDNFAERSTVTVGPILSAWMDEKIKAHQWEVQVNWANGKMKFPEHEVEGRTVEIQKGIQLGGFATQLEGNTTFWAESAATYLADTRRLAGQGKDITRVFILRSEDSLKNAALITQMRLDKKAGIKTLVAFSDGPKKITDPEAVKDFGIWDEKLLCLVELTHHTGRVTGCTYSVDEADLTRAGRWKDNILRHAEQADAYLT